MIPLASDALAGIRVIDLSRVRSGPTAVRQFAGTGVQTSLKLSHQNLLADGLLVLTQHT